MRHPRTDKPHRPQLGSVHRDEVLPLQELGRRMGWGNEMLATVQRDGLKAVTIGRRKYVTGAAVYAFVEQQAERGGRGNG